MKAITVVLSNRKGQAPHDGRKRMQSRKVWVPLGFIAGLLSLGWFVLALGSGNQCEQNAC